MNILLLSNEYPPNVYGGAGVHVDHLVRELERCDDGRHRLQVLCFGDQEERSAGKSVTGISPLECLSGRDLLQPKLMDPLFRNLLMAGTVGSADVVHCHTWYTHLAGCLLKQLVQAPLVVTTHSLEPHRPWKKEQLGNGYYAAAWLERTALVNADRIIAVSRAMREDVLDLFDVAPENVEVIYNGIDTGVFRETRDTGVLRSYGIDPEVPFVLFVGRITRQKGIVHLLGALHHTASRPQIVLCAGAADTPEIAAEVEAGVASLQADGHPVVWIREMVPVERLVPLYSHAALFVCPSVYEPFGIINLEAMACGTPVVASAVGGIPEVVEPGCTGLLVPFEPAGPEDAEPRDPDRLSRDLAAAIDELMRSPEQRESMGRAARQRVEEHFSWKKIARQTLETYARLTRG
ncbi:MAG: glycogen synthase [Desulfobacterales bacterium]